MLPIHKIIWNEWREKRMPVRVPEPEAMTDPEQIRSYVKAYEWGGPTSALQLYHLRCLSRMIRPGDRILDMACGPGPLLLELARLYPDCQFVGADLSQPMLDALHQQALADGLKNVETLREDIRSLPSVSPGSIDLVISTSALHHLPDLASLRASFERTKIVMKPDARVYFFDFGLLKAKATRALMVAEVAKLALPLTVKDYGHSLDAAFAIQDVFGCSRDVFGSGVGRYRSRFVDFFYFLRSEASVDQVPSQVADFLRDTLKLLGAEARAELGMLGVLQRRVGLGTRDI